MEAKILQAENFFSARRPITQADARERTGSKMDTTATTAVTLVVAVRR